MKTNRIMKILSLFVFIIWTTITFNGQGVALEVKTHKAINRYIVDEDSPFPGYSLDKYLKINLGINDGVKAKFNLKMLKEWFGDGGEFEDKPPECIVPYQRSRNHFHNPIDNSGFSAWWDTLGIIKGVSVIDWINKPIDTQGCGYYSWNDAREYYYAALTKTDKATRETNFAETFRSLGQLMHLIQDMSVPEHTRNNGHYIAYDYEKWVDDPEKRGPLTDYSNPIKYFVPDSSFPLNIRNLFDTEQYNKTNPDITFNSNIGLSEYTSANFLSPDTIFNKPNSPYPAYDQTEYNKTMAGNLYLTKRGHGDGNGSGERIETLARAENFYNYLPTDYKQLALTVKDPIVYKEYANKLIPRAIGYSSQLLKYFFRGSLEISLPGSKVYSVTTADDGFDKITLSVKNNSVSTDEMTDGEIYLVLKYKVAQSDPFQSVPVPVSSDFTYRVIPEKNNIRAIPRTPVNLTFDLSSQKMPLWATDVYLQVVYKGKMGAEDNAIAVGFKDISEPTPMDFINIPNTCYHGTWVASGSDAAVTMADTNGDGIADSDIYPHLFKDMYVKISSPGASENSMTATVDHYTYKAASVATGQYSRAYILSDEEFVFHSRLQWVPVDSRDTYPELEDVLDYYITFNTVTNQTEHESTQTCCEITGVPSCGTDYSNPNCCERLYEAGCNVRYYSEFEKYMDIYRWAMLRGYMRIGTMDCEF